MAIQTIIFDFDGTIADTFEAIVAITNDLAPEFGYRPATPQEVEKLRHLRPRQVIRRSGISIFRLPQLLWTVRKQLNERVQELKAIPGMIEVLQGLKQQDYRLGIVTSNTRDNVTQFLKLQNIESLFSFIYSGTTLFGKHKVLRKVLSQESLQPEQVLYVGDEARDIEAAKRVNIGAIAVGWGFNSSQALATLQPDFLAERPADLLPILNSRANI